MSVRTAAAAAACALLAAAGVATPAVADSGGAQVVDQSGCQSYLDGFVTVCSNEHAEYTIATAPNGDVNFADNGRFDYTVTYSTGYSYTETGYFHEHELVARGQTPEFGGHFADTVTTNGYGTCTWSGDTHYAGGQYQFINLNFVCTP